jgi:hypothetical protein
MFIRYDNIILMFTFFFFTFYLQNYIYSSGLTACYMCPSGSYQSQIGQNDMSDCLPCDGGSYQDNIGNIYYNARFLHVIL